MYSLRISGDIPIQSEYLPLIMLYFVLSMVYTFLSLCWFVLCNYLTTRNIWPKCLLNLAQRGLSLFKSKKSQRASSTFKTNMVCSALQVPSVLTVIKELQRENSKEPKEQNEKDIKNLLEQLVNNLNKSAACKDCRFKADFERKKKKKNLIIALISLTLWSV